MCTILKMVQFNRLLMDSIIESLVLNGRCTVQQFTDIFVIWQFCFLIANQQYVRQSIHPSAINSNLWNLQDMYVMKSLMRAYTGMLMRLPGMHPIKIKMNNNTLYLTLYTMSTMHQVFTVTMTNTEVMPFGAFRISFFTYTVPKYPQPFCHT